MRKRTSFVGVIILVCMTASMPRRDLNAADKPGPSGILGRRFVDRSFGFSLRPFANAKINQHKIDDPLGGYQLVEFVHLTRPWVLLVHLNRSNGRIRPTEYIDGLRAYCAVRHQGVETLGKSERLIAARQAAVWNGRYRQASGSWSIFEAAVQVHPDEYFRIILKVPTADEGMAAAVFDIVIDSFEMLHSEVNAERLEGALLLGRGLLHPTDPVNLGSLADAEAYMMVSRSGKELGYAQIREYAETRNGQPGLRIQERGWLFPSDKEFHRVRNDFFISNDLRSSMFEMRVLVYTYGQDGRPPIIAEKIERGIRENDKLILSYTEELGDTILLNTVLQVTGTYIPLGLLRVLPRIVPLDEPELYAFSSYSGVRKDLVLRTFRVLGRPAPQEGVSPDYAFAVQDTEGITPPASTIYLDEGTRVRRIVAGEDDLVRSSQARTHLMYGARVTEAKAKLKQLGLPAD